MLKLSPGKLWGMRRLADANGRWKMIAIDQRTPLMGPVAQKRGVKEAPFKDLSDIKISVIKHLSPYSSAMLLDPNYAYPYGVHELSPAKGLILAVEDHVTDENAGGRKSKLIPDWSVEKISKIGGDAVKLLIWYRPDAHHSVNEHQQRLVKQVGDECRKYDKVLLLELLVYPLASDEPGFLERSRSKLVQDSLRDFSSLEFGVDIYKLEPPAQINSVPDPHGPAAAAYQKSFDQLSQLTSKPWVLLSAAAGPTDFMHSLTYAYRANASGYLCGRAIWQAAFEKFPNFALLNEVLIQDSVKYVNKINELTDKLALPWIKHPAYGGDIFMPNADSMLTNSFSSFYVAE